MRRYFFVFLLMGMVNSSFAAVITVEIVQPKLDETPYHRPYVAVWLETPKRKAVATLAVWHGEDKWLKDLRQWWRKVGRSAKAEIDTVSGASRRPDQYIIEWDGKDNHGQPVPAGKYLLNVEAVREEGGRDYLRQQIEIGQSGEIVLPAKKEIGPIKVIWE